jgi:ubiquinone/menaquinone biosynthesis C-methylase UbiE
MEPNVCGVRLNLGCGYTKWPGWVNVDAYDVCQPDVVHDLDVTPFPWADNSVDEVQAWHVFEHLRDWWPAFTECARILRPGGVLEVRTPHESSKTALTYRDHNHIFSTYSFHGIYAMSGKVLGHGTNAWAATETGSVPLVMIGYFETPHKKYNWMLRFPRILQFCSEHMRNFIHESRFIFIKLPKEAL